MRWEGLFADLEGQLAAEQRRERDDEVAERTRRERALVTLPGRLAAAVGAPCGSASSAAGRSTATCTTCGEDWVLARTHRRARGARADGRRGHRCGPWGRSPRSARTARRFGLGYALRALSRDRATVAVSLVGGGRPLLGTIDAVGADHLDLAEHDEGVPRRRENVRAVATVPFAALVAVESRR